MIRSSVSTRGRPVCAPRTTILKARIVAKTALACGAFIALGETVGPPAAHAQWVRESEQFYLPAAHNWVFRDHYIGADRLFNAGDSGHALLSEPLYREEKLSRTTASDGEVAMAREVILTARRLLTEQAGYDEIGRAHV